MTSEGDIGVVPRPCQRTRSSVVPESIESVSLSTKESKEYKENCELFKEEMV